MRRTKVSSAWSMALVAAFGAALSAPGCGSDDVSATPGDGGSDDGGRDARGEGGSGGGTSGGSFGGDTAGNTAGSGSAGSASAGSGSASGGSGGAADASCAASTVEAPRVPATILFVIDRSGSMNCNPPPTQTTAQCEALPAPVNASAPTKWGIIRDAIKLAVAQLPAGTLGGILYFNTDDDCGIVRTPQVPIALLDAAKLASVNASLNNVTPRGATPFVGATTYAYEYLRTSNPPGKKFVVVVTDGAETCDPGFKSTFLTQRVPLSVQYQFRTFVLGAPGSEPDRAFLSAVASSGGTARVGCNPTNPATPADSCHFDMTDPNVDFAVELPKALDAVSREALSCEFDVPKPPPGQTIDYGKVNVTFTPSTGGARPVLQDTTKPCNAGADGWVYSPDRSKIVLCGPACAALKSDAGAKVSIALGCATETRPIPR